MTTPTNELYQPLIEAYECFNARLFNNALPGVIFTLQRKKHVAGYFVPKRWGNLDGGTCNEIAINPSYFADSRIIEVFQTLVHEMVHAWQHHYGSPSKDHYHNREWAQKMIEIGLMPSTTGEPGGDIVGRHMSDYIIKKGRFFQVASELINDKAFSLSWVDRLALPRLKEPVIADIDVMNTDEEVCDIENLNATINDAETEINTESLYEYYSSLSSDNNKKPSQTLPNSFFIAQSDVARKTRVKYFGEGCEKNCNVYGRAGLNLICGDCNRKLITQD